jgi:hypothetical protein
LTHKDGSLFAPAPPLEKHNLTDPRTTFEFLRFLTQEGYRSAPPKSHNFLDFWELARAHASGVEVVKAKRSRGLTRLVKRLDFPLDAEHAARL